MLSRIVAYVSELLGRRRSLSEADEELRFHIERETAANVARGATPREARRMALRDLGGLTQTRESVRGVRTIWAELLWRDVRHGLLSLRRTPTFTLSALATLTLVIGANVAVFTLVDAIVWRPLPYPKPDRLGRLSRATAVGSTIQFGGSSVDGRLWDAVRTDAVAMMDLAAMADGSQRVNFYAGERAASVSQARVGAGYFRVLGVMPASGREFTAEEDRPGGPAVAVISHALWESAFRTDPDTVGKSMLLRGEAYQIVGILPERFINPGEPADVFTPLRPSRSGEGGGSNYSVIARIRDGHSWADANGLLLTLSSPLFPPATTPQAPSRRLVLRPFQDVYVEGTREPLNLLAGASAVVLLIACVNLAALVLARTSSRQQEIATRLALGSGRIAVVRQLVVESLLLGAGGGLFGLLIGSLSLTALQTMGGEIFVLWRRSDITIGVRTIVATGIVAVLASLAMGLVPALASSRLNVNAVLVGGGSRGVAGRARHWGRRVLIAVEIALSVVLLVSAGLFVRTLVNLRGLEPGFDPNGVVTASVSLQDARYASASAITHLFDASLAELTATPGVLSAAVSLGLPYDRLLNDTFRFADRPRPEQAQLANFMYVTPGFFDTLRIPLKTGRGLTADDRQGQALVAVVNDAFVRAWARDASPIGRRLTLRNGDVEVVGIVGDMQVRNSGFSVPGLENSPLMKSPIVFIPAAQFDEKFLSLVHQWFTPQWVVRTVAGTSAEPILHRAINIADPRLPVGPVSSLADVQASSMALQRLMLVLVGACATVALLLASVGIYGLLAQTVLEREREFGIRIALGATTRGIFASVIQSGLVLGLVGVSVGSVLAWISTRLMRTFLWGVDVHDPTTFVVIVVTLLITATISSALPALQTLRIDPGRTLRG